MRLILLATLATGSVFALAGAQAATFMTSAMKPTAGSVVEQTAAKKRPGSCGTYMYYDRKAKACADARLKKAK